MQAKKSKLSSPGVNIDKTNNISRIINCDKNNQLRLLPKRLNKNGRFSLSIKGDHKNFNP